MAEQKSTKGALVIGSSLAAAMVFNIIPLPQALESFRPDWVAMVTVYWVMALPNRVGVIFAWFIGLFMDVLNGTLLGIHAISMSLVAYLTLMTYHRLRLFPRWKQAINVMVMVGIGRLLTLLLNSLVVPMEVNFTYWLPLIGVVIFWPWLFILLRDLRRQFNIQ